MLRARALKYNFRAKTESYLQVLDLNCYFRVACEASQHHHAKSLFQPENRLFKQFHGYFNYYRVHCRLVSVPVIERRRLLEVKMK